MISRQRTIQCQSIPNKDQVVLTTAKPCDHLQDLLARTNSFYPWSVSFLPAFRLRFLYLAVFNYPKDFLFRYNPTMALSTVLTWLNSCLLRIFYGVPHLGKTGVTLHEFDSGINYEYLYQYWRNFWSLVQVESPISNRNASIVYLHREVEETLAWGRLTTSLPMYQQWLRGIFQLSNVGDLMIHASVIPLSINIECF